MSSMTDCKESSPFMELFKEWYEEAGLHKYEDMLLPKGVNAELLPKIKAFEFDERDILISTYPRSGTTWTQEMTWLVCNNANVDMAKEMDLDLRSPFIEYKLSHLAKPNIEILEKTPAPRIIKTHFPPQFFEIQRQEVQFKTIVVMRNLKDVLVSNFHFYKDLFNFRGTWDDFFEMFKNDMIMYGSWVKHCLKCWELRADPNVLLLKYEAIKANPTEGIQKIANFCGKSLSEDQVTAIVDYTFVGNMKKMKMNSKRATENPKLKTFIRKGVVGDWKELFSDDQSKYVAELLTATTEKEGLAFVDNLA